MSPTSSQVVLARAATTSSSAGCASCCFSHCCFSTAGVAGRGVCVSKEAWPLAAAGKQRKGNKMSPVAGTKMNRSVVPVSSSSANLGRPAEVRTLEDMMQAVRPLVQQLDRSQA